MQKEAEEMREGKVEEGRGIKLKQKDEKEQKYKINETVEKKV